MTSKKATQQQDSSDKHLDEQTAHLQEQITDLTEALQHERADAVNLRRRHEEAMAGVKSRAKTTVIRELLPVIDNFERALKHVPQELEGDEYIKGVQGIVKQFEKVLADLGVAKIKTVGHAFDPEMHEAVSMDDSAGGSEEVVSEELQAGYRLGDDVIRHAMVRVATK